MERKTKIRKAPKIFWNLPLIIVFLIHMFQLTSRFFFEEWLEVTLEVVRDPAPGVPEGEVLPEIAQGKNLLQY